MLFRSHTHTHATNRSSGYNTEACSWDGGDCCQDTCSDGQYSCGFATSTFVGFPFCSDPASSAAACNVTAWSFIGDGYCDSAAPYNTANCSWDGGDCCSNTCEPTAYLCGVYGAFYCLDPDQEGATTDAPSVECLGTTSWLGDGYCDDWPQNTEACNWDEGDCCEETCVDVNYTCGYVGPIFMGWDDCADPSYAKDTTEQRPGATTLQGGDVTTGGDSDATTNGGVTIAETTDYYSPYLSTEGTACTAVAASWLADGFCDDDANNGVCDWDGGDCCKPTCVSSLVFTCGYSLDSAYVGFD